MLLSMEGFKLEMLIKDDVLLLLLYIRVYIYFLSILLT